MSSPSPRSRTKSRSRSKTAYNTTRRNRLPSLGRVELPLRVSSLVDSRSAESSTPPIQLRPSTPPSRRASSGQRFNRTGRTYRKLSASQLPLNITRRQYSKLSIPKNIPNSELLKHLSEEFAAQMDPKRVDRIKSEIDTTLNIIKPLEERKERLMAIDDDSLIQLEYSLRLAKENYRVLFCRYSLDICEDNDDTIKKLNQYIKLVEEENDTRMKEQQERKDRDKLYVSKVANFYNKKLELLKKKLAENDRNVQQNIDALYSDYNQFTNDYEAYILDKKRWFEQQIQNDIEKFRVERSHRKQSLKKEIDSLRETNSQTKTSRIASYNKAKRNDMNRAERRKHVSFGPNA